MISVQLRLLYGFSPVLTSIEQLKCTEGLSSFSQSFSNLEMLVRTWRNGIEELQIYYKRMMNDLKNQNSLENPQTNFTNNIDSKLYSEIR